MTGEIADTCSSAASFGLISTKRWCFKSLRSSHLSCPNVRCSQIQSGDQRCFNSVISVICASALGWFDFAEATKRINPTAAAMSPKCRLRTCSTDSFVHLKMGLETGRSKLPLINRLPTTVQGTAGLNLCQARRSLPRPDHGGLRQKLIADGEPVGETETGTQCS